MRRHKQFVRLIDTSAIRYAMGEPRYVAQDNDSRLRRDVVPKNPISQILQGAPINQLRENKVRAQRGQVEPDQQVALADPVAHGHNISER